MNFDEWCAQNKAYLDQFAALHATQTDAAVERAVEQAHAELRDERANTLSALRLVADLRAAIGDDGKRMQPELIEYVRQLAADAASFRFLDGMNARTPATKEKP